MSMATGRAATRPFIVSTFTSGWTLLEGGNERQQEGRKKRLTKWDCWSQGFVAQRSTNRNARTNKVEQAVYTQKELQPYMCVCVFYFDFCSKSTWHYIFIIYSMKLFMRCGTTVKQHKELVLVLFCWHHQPPSAPYNLRSAKFLIAINRFQFHLHVKNVVILFMYQDTFCVHMNVKQFLPEFLNWEPSEHKERIK